MSALESVRIALESLGAHKLRTVLTMIGMVIGIGSVIAIVAIGKGTEKEVLRQLNGEFGGSIAILPAEPDPARPNAVMEPLTEADIASLRSLLPDVKGVFVEATMEVPVKHGRRSMAGVVKGAYAATLEVRRMKLAMGRWITDAEEHVGAPVVVVGADVPRRLLGDDPDPLGKTVYIAGYPFKVIGVTHKRDGFLDRLSEAEDLSYYVPLSVVQRITGNRHIEFAMVYVRDGADSEQVMQDAVALLERNHRGARFQGINLDQLGELTGQVTSLITSVFAAIAGISLVVGGVGIMNIMLVSVTERTREIGIRKALGATYRDILAQFLIEAVALSLIGGAVGLAIAGIPVWMIGRWMKIPLLIDWQAALLAVGISAAVGVMFGVYPAARAARLNPIEALRYE